MGADYPKRGSSKCRGYCSTSSSIPDCTRGMYSSPLLTSYVRYSSTLVRPPSVGRLVGHLGLPLFGLHRLLCLRCVVCPTDGCRTFQTRSDVHCSCRDCSFHHHLVECLCPCWIQDNNGALVSQAMLPRHSFHHYISKGAPSNRNCIRWRREHVQSGA